MKTRTYVVNVNGLSKEAEAKVRDHLQALFGYDQKIFKTPDGLLGVEWSAYKAGHDARSSYISALNAGIAFAMNR
jgi:hypothetical protein